MSRKRYSIVLDNDDAGDLYEEGLTLMQRHGVPMPRSMAFDFFRAIRTTSRREQPQLLPKDLWVRNLVKSTETKQAEAEAYWDFVCRAMPLLTRWQSGAKVQEFKFGVTLFAHVCRQVVQGWRSFSNGDTPSDEGVQVARFISMIEAYLPMLLVRLRQCDHRVLQLMSLLGEEEGESFDVLDMFEMMAREESALIANFALDLLPSVLETAQDQSAQLYAIDGLASIETKGVIHNLVPSELAFEPMVFAQRYLERELFYFAREKHQENESREIMMLIDASASMRGLRNVFARGLAVARMKQLILLGEDASFRFFDADLHELRRVQQGSLSLAYLLSFQSTQGRCMDRVLRELIDESEGQSVQSARTRILTFVTHPYTAFENTMLEKLRSRNQLEAIVVHDEGEDFHAPFSDSFDSVHHVKVGHVASRENAREIASTFLESERRTLQRTNERKS